MIKTVKFHTFKRMTDQIEELESSELGTKDYWESSYETEIRNYRDHGDVGEIWFDEDSQLRIIRWIERQEDRLQQDDSFIDLGEFFVTDLEIVDVQPPMKHFRLWKWHDADRNGTRRLFQSYRCGLFP